LAYGSDWVYPLEMANLQGQASGLVDGELRSPDRRKRLPHQSGFPTLSPGYPRVALRFHDAGGLAQSAVPALAVRGVPRRPVGARHLALVESDQGALVVFNRTCVLTNIAGVINTAGQFAEIALFNRFQGAYADLGGFSDLLKRYATVAANRGQA